jgi:hypothetical protein
LLVHCVRVVFADDADVPRALPLALVLGVLAGAAVVWATRPPGPGLDPDSMSYLSAADSLVENGSLRVPFDDWPSPTATRRLKHFPPGFPLAIAALRSFGMPIERSAAWVEAVAAFFTIAGIVLVVASRVGTVAGVVAALAVAITPAFVENHYVVLSEPLFLALLVAFVASAASRRASPWPLGIVAAAAVLVRYAGLALPLAAAAWCVIDRRTRRVIAALTAGAPGVVGFVAWARWAGRIRRYGWQTGFRATLGEGARTVEAWLVPALAPSPLRLGLALAATAGLVVVVVRGVWLAWEQRASALRLFAAAGITAAVYGPFVITSRLFADGGIPFDGRILSPLLLLATIAVVTALAVQWTSLSALVRGAVVAAAVTWSIGSARVVAADVAELCDDGWGFASADWQGSELAGWLRGPGTGYELYSDNAPALDSLVHRPSRTVPDSTDDETLRAFAGVLAAHPSAIVAFAEPDAKPGARGHDFARLLGFREALRSDDGDVFVDRAP